MAAGYYCKKCGHKVRGHEYKTPTGKHKWACDICNSRYYINEGRV
jgi:DNA-directed RNA polymerase subunit RPC12/RpoP